MVLQPAPVRADGEDLPLPAKEAGEGGGAALVQFGEDVVEEKNRRFTHLLPEKPSRGDFEREHRRPVLTAGTEVPYRFSVEKNIHVVPVRTDRGSSRP